MGLYVLRTMYKYTTMAKIYEEVVIIKFSKLVKGDQVVGTVASADIVAALEQVAQELVGDGTVVEVEKA